MARVRVLTPVVDVKDNMEDAQALNVDRLGAGKVRIGLLDNTKPNTAQLLGFVGELLTEHKVAASTYAADKTDSPAANPASHGATEAVFGRLTQNTDLVLTGLGN
jgi:hypothetical protein